MVVEGPIARTQIARVETLICYFGKYFAIVTLMMWNGVQVDEGSRLKILKESGQALRSVEMLLEPLYVVHLCNSACEAIGPGFEGKHSAHNEYLYNEYIVL